MCGRFVQNIPFQILQKNFNVHGTAPEITPNYNVAPTQEILAIIKQNNENTMERLHWGLVPFWAKDINLWLLNQFDELYFKQSSFLNRIIHRQEPKICAR